MNTKFIFTVILLGFFLIIFNISYYNPTSKKPADTISSIKLSFVGDLMCHTPQMDYAKTGKDSFDFNPVFDYVRNYLDSADLTFGNLETVITGKEKKYTGYPRFNAPEEFLKAVKDAGFDILFTSNNHAFDRGKRGLLSNIEKIKEHGIIPIGTFVSQIDRDSVRIIDVKGIKIGIQSYSYGLNGNVLPKGEDYLVNLIDTNLIRFDINAIKKNNPDLILIYFHFGEEYSRKPTAFQNTIVEKTFNYGADIIIASHPHVVEQIEEFGTNNKKMNIGISAYSLGNFISNQRWRYSDAGIILNLQITKDINKDSLWINNVSIIPTWVFKGKIDSLNQYRILPADTSLLKPLPTFLTKDEIQKMTQSFNDTRQMFLIKNQF